MWQCSGARVITHGCKAALTAACCAFATLSMHEGSTSASSVTILCTDTGELARGLLTVQLSSAERLLVTAEELGCAAATATLQALRWPAQAEASLPKHSGRHSHENWAVFASYRPTPQRKLGSALL